METVFAVVGFVACSVGFGAAAIEVLERLVDRRRVKEYDAVGGRSEG